MNWNRFFKIVIINILLIPGLAVIILGLIGFLLAGQEGLKSGVTWGLVLGLVSIPFSIATIVTTKYWEYYSGRFGRWFVKKETEGEGKQQWLIAIYQHLTPAPGDSGFTAGYMHPTRYGAIMIVAAPMPYRFA